MDNNNQEKYEPISLERLTLICFIAAIAVILPYNLMERVTYNKAGEEIYSNVINDTHSDIVITAPTSYGLEYDKGADGASIYSGKIHKGVCSTIALKILHQLKNSNEDESHKVITINGYKIESRKDIHKPCQLSMEEDKIIIK